MILETPQIIFLILMVVGLMGTLINEPAKEFILSVIGAVITIGLLYWGGFFG